MLYILNICIAYIYVIIIIITIIFLTYIFTFLYIYVYINRGLPPLVLCAPFVSDANMLMLAGLMSQPPGLRSPAPRSQVSGPRAPRSQASGPRAPGAALRRAADWWTAGSEGGLSRPLSANRDPRM